MYFTSDGQNACGARNSQRPFFWAAAFVASLLTANLAHAAPINYGNFDGNTVDYLQVTEDSPSGDTVPLFGSPNVTGDSIDFNPVGFNANSAGGGVPDTTVGTLQFDVRADQDFAIENINFAEVGETTLAGSGTDATSTAVTANVIIDILEVDGVGINEISVPTSMTFSPSGSYSLATDGGGAPFYATQWTGSLLVDIAQILDDETIDFNQGATLISVSVTNSLTATSEANTTAVVSKTDFGGLSVTVNVPDQGQIPEPATAALAMMGVGLLALKRRGVRRV